MEDTMLHECALINGKKRCSGCEIGIVGGTTETIETLNEKLDKSSELLNGNKIQLFKMKYNEKVVI